MDFKGIFIVFTGPNYNMKSAATEIPSDGKVYSQLTGGGFDSEIKQPIVRVLAAHPLVDKTIIA